METFKTNDGIRIAYRDVGDKTAPVLILIHGFTGSSAVFQRNIPALSQSYRVIAPDLRGHGDSDKPAAGFHVARLARDLWEMIEWLGLGGRKGEIKAMGTSLGAAVLWSYAELFTPAPFSHLLFIDQAPLQNYTSDGTWGPTHGNRGCNSAAALAAVQATLRDRPDDAYRDTISACLAYRWDPRPDDGVTTKQTQEDEAFFLEIARKGNGVWFGNLMADHTALDWRASIAHTLGPTSAYRPRVLVVTSSRSGCFPAAGPLYVVDLVNSGGNAQLKQSSVRPSLSGTEEDRATGVVVDWGGHWCYWEDPQRFDSLVLDFLRG